MWRIGAPAWLAALLLVGCISGCVSVRVLDAEADRAFRSREFSQAAGKLEAAYKSKLESARKTGGNFEDELLYLLDWALALHTAGEYEASNAIFVLAEKHVWGNDYTSVTEEVGTLLTGENTKVYRGEDFEKVLINVYKALNYALLGRGEEALVEARLVDRRLQAMKREGGRPYKQNGFARYLSAILYESQLEWNDAYIDYKKTREIVPGFSPLGPDLIRIARKLGMRDQVERWSGEFQVEPSSVEKTGSSEIIVVFQNGLGPRKVPRDDFPSLPRFKPYRDSVHEAAVSIDGEERGRTALLHDIEATAIENLEERVGGMLAKRIAGRVVKELAARELERRTGSPVVGVLTWAVLVASDQADLRSWLFLPRDLQIARISVAPGRHQVQVRPVGGEELPAQEVEIRPGEKKLVNFRRVP